MQNRESHQGVPLWQEGCNSGNSVVLSPPVKTHDHGSVPLSEQLLLTEMSLENP